MSSTVMATAIHIELDALCILIMVIIGYQSFRNVSQQMNRVLFRYMVYGIICALALDIAWLLLEGKQFPGALFLNRLANALFLSCGVLLGCLWYLYVLDTLGYRITRGLACAVLSPAILFTVINLLSMKTEWTFAVTPENIYMRGSLFWLQTVGAFGMLLISLVHILVRLIRGTGNTPRRNVLKLLGFYIIPVVGAVASLPFTNMPGVWTSAAISIVLIYIDDQDREILRDSLTGLNNRKTLDTAFADYTRQLAPDRGLYLFMIDLDNFKRINDTLGHPVGDQALVDASRLLTGCAGSLRGIIVRYGGDEFLIMGFFPGDTEAQRFKETLSARFEDNARQTQAPYRLAASVGWARYDPGQTLAQFIQTADDRLYADKAARKRAASA